MRYSTLSFLCVHFLLISTCTDFDNFTNCLEPESPDYKEPDLVFDNLNAVYDTSHIVINWVESEYCGITDYQISLINTSYEVPDRIIPWNTNNFVEFDYLDDGLYAMEIAVHYDIMDEDTSIQIETFSAEFEVDYFNENHLRISPMYNTIIQNSGSQYFFDIIAEEIDLSMVDGWTENSGIIGFGISLAVNNKIEITEIESISQYFSGYSNQDSSQTLEMGQLWDITEIDNTVNLLEISLVNELGDNQGIDQLTYIVVRVRFSYTGDYTPEMMNIDFIEDETSFYTCLNLECTSFQNLEFSNIHNGIIEIKDH